MTDWYWHIHHDLICEPLTEPLQNRLDYIRDNKPSYERETRLRLIAPVTVELPAALVKKWAFYIKAWAASDKAWADSTKAWATSNKAWTAYDKAAQAQAGMPSIKAEKAYVKAQAASDKAEEASDKAEETHAKAQASTIKVWEVHNSELRRLHTIDCPAALAGTCPWDGKTIFPTGDTI